MSNVVNQLETKRVFVAVDVSPEVRQAAARLAESLKDEFPGCRASWTKPQNLHITLEFLGEIDAAELAAVKDCVSRAASAAVPFTLELDGTGVFRSRSPVLWLGIKDPSGGLSLLKRKLDETLRSTGREPERRRFTPHLTLARIKEFRNCGDMARSAAATAVPSVLFEVNEAVIYQSRLVRTGAEYTALSRHRFAVDTDGTRI